MCIFLPCASKPSDWAFVNLKNQTIWTIWLPTGLVLLKCDGTRNGFCIGTANHATLMRNLVLQRDRIAKPFAIRWTTYARRVCSGVNQSGRKELAILLSGRTKRRWFDFRDIYRGYTSTLPEMNPIGKSLLNWTDQYTYFDSDNNEQPCQSVWLNRDRTSIETTDWNRWICQSRHTLTYAAVVRLCEVSIWIRDCNLYWDRSQKRPVVTCRFGRPASELFTIVIIIC